MMLIQPLRIVQSLVFLSLCVVVSQTSTAQTYYGYSVGYAPAPVAVVTPPPVAAYPVPVAVPAPYYSARVAVPYVAPVAVARYSVARVAVPAPRPVAYYAPRPVVVRPKYYVPFQPVRNAVRAVTP